MGWHMGWGGGMFFGGFLFLLILVGVVVVAMLLVRNSGNQGRERTYPVDRGQREIGPSPLEILETRYAKGEIDREEYETKRRDLEPTYGSSQAR